MNLHKTKKKENMPTVHLSYVSFFVAFIAPNVFGHEIFVTFHQFCSILKHLR